MKAPCISLKSVVSKIGYFYFDDIVEIFSKCALYKNEDTKKFAFTFSSNP